MQTQNDKISIIITIRFPRIRNTKYSKLEYSSWILQTLTNSQQYFSYVMILLHVPYCNPL